jgi:hypothetical protein
MTIQNVLNLMLIVVAIQSPAAGAADKTADAKASAAASVTVKSLAGAWLGALDAGGKTVRLQLDVNESDGKLSAVLTSIDQGNAKVPVTSISGDADGARFECAAIAGSFEGKYSTDGAELTGTWKQGPNSLPLTFKRQK